MSININFQDMIQHLAVTKTKAMQSNKEKILSLHCHSCGFLKIKNTNLQYLLIKWQKHEM